MAKDNPVPQEGIPFEFIPGWEAQPSISVIGVSVKVRVGDKPCAKSAVTRKPIATSKVQI